MNEWKKTPWKKIDVENMDVECKKYSKEIRGKEILFKLYILDLVWLEFHVNILHNQEYYLLLLLNVIF
jgi:hypothetical protein